MTELLVGTKKGLFVLEGEPGAGSRSPPARSRASRSSTRCATRAPAACFAAMSSPFYGPKIFFADDPGGEWEQAEGVELPEGGDQALEKLWILRAGEAEGTLYAGGDPGVLFESRDGGSTGSSTGRCGSTPRAPKWQPGGGGLCLHTI